MHISIGNISKMVSDATEIITAIKYDVTFRFLITLSYLEFTLTDSIGQLGYRNGISPNIFAFFRFVIVLSFAFVLLSFYYATGK